MFVRSEQTILHPLSRRDSPSVINARYDHLIFQLTVLQYRNGTQIVIVTVQTIDQQIGEKEIPYQDAPRSNILANSRTQRQHPAKLVQVNLTEESN